MSTQSKSNALPVIQSLWIGGRLSTMERLSINSFLKNGHEFHLYVYDEVKDVPEGVVIRDGNTIVDSNRIFKYKKEGSYAGFSNVFRYKLLHDKGNYWVDLDVVCFKPFDLTQEYVFSGAQKRRFFGLAPSKTFIQSCVIKTPPGSAIMKYCYEISSSKNTDQLVWGEIGPNLLQSAVYKFGLQKFVSDHCAFTTIDWPLTERFVSGSLFTYLLERVRMSFHNPYATHLNHEMWRQKGLDKDGKFPDTSLYELFKRQYLNMPLLLWSGLPESIRDLYNSNIF